MQRFSLRTGFLAAGVLVLCGCPGMSPKDNARFQTLVAKNVVAGMPLATATQRLATAGFSCDYQAAAPAVTCTRSRQSLLPYSCIQRVNLSTDATGTNVTNVTPMPIACAGL